MLSKRCLLLLLVLIVFTFSVQTPKLNSIDHKQEMCNFVIGISKYAKLIKPSFNIVPQNGIDLVTTNGDETGQPNTEYLNAIDANGQEDLFYGYHADNSATPKAVRNKLKELLVISKNAGKQILVTDYCYSTSKMHNSYFENSKAGFVSYAADKRELNNIPTFPLKLEKENNAVVTSISQVKNFLYLINPSNYTSKENFIKAVASSNYDLLIMDLYFNEKTIFTAAEVNQLKTKNNGGKRLLLSYMSIGEAESYRYYWQQDWTSKKPIWLDKENPNWAGNYKVKYWNSAWQNIIYGNDSSYLKKIIDADFDGVYLDIIDAFEFYEK